MIDTQPSVAILENTPKEIQKEVVTVQEEKELDISSIEESIILIEDKPKNGLEGNPGQNHRYQRMMDNKSGSVAKYFESK
jgi:hypothetical protein